MDRPFDTRKNWRTLRGSAEPDGRSTNGRAVIPATLAKDGPITIELAATTRYPAPQSARQRA